MNDNYMKTILSGVKEWTENLTDDAKDKANNALEQANKSIDKALFVVNITPNSDGTYSADKTFYEIVQAYNEGKYSIVAKVFFFTMPLLAAQKTSAVFGMVLGQTRFSFVITSNNEVQREMIQLATTNSKLPNPHPLTFTGAVTGSYDGSSPKTIEIPSGGGSGAHSDWNQNDSTAADYIKNRPFYMGDPVETVLVEERTVSFVEQEGSYVAQFQSTFEATAGEVYKVSWDGTVYECTCVDVSDTTIIGNLSIIGAGSDTGEPFVMGIRNGVGITIATADTSASHTFSISGFVSEVVKIDEKYLPEAAFRVRNLDTTKSYSTEEIEEIYKSARSGSVVYYLDGSIVTELLYTANESLSCVLSDGSSISISPIDNVWDFSNPKTKYPPTIAFASRYYSYANIATGFTNVVGGVDAFGYELVGTNLAGFIGNYIQAIMAIVLKVKNVSKYLYITANENGEIEVSIRTHGQASGGVETTLFKNGDDSMILKSSTEGSTKKFKITVDDSGTITATEVV